MNNIIESKLFTKHFVIATEESGKEQFTTAVSLIEIFNVKITKGASLLHPDMIKTFSRELGHYVPEAFYRGFPESVRELTSEQLLVDQMWSYVKTYGFCNFEESQHSIFEEYERKAFTEKDIPLKEFQVVTHEEAVSIAKEIFDNILSGTRPLNMDDLAFVANCISEIGFVPVRIASKNTAVQLFLGFKDTNLLGVAGCNLADTIKIVDEINYGKYNNKNLKKLAFEPEDKELVRTVIDFFFERGVDLKTISVCCEKKKIWCGLLHHIQYKANKDASKQEFLSVIRGKKNLSIYSEFESAMKLGFMDVAADILKNEKGNAELLRHLNYIISRCKTDEEVESVIDQIDAENGIVLLQLLFQYNYYGRGQRTFTFTKHNLQKQHIETDEEMARRKSELTEEMVRKLANAIGHKVIDHYSKKINQRVYIDPAMKKIALPMQETTGSSGFGVLPKGSRIAIPEGKKIRAFTYWEKVNDIDLSCFGLTPNGRKEFSWRTMSNNQSEAITYSGDQTSGYNGGSEYFDIDLDRFKAMYPDVTHIVFCNNVFSNVNFANCFCKAGFMMRDIEDSGEIFEPKTVSTSFVINAETTYGYLFAIDLSTREMIWLNIGDERRRTVAGSSSMDFIRKYFDYANIISVYDLFIIAASQVVNNPEDAEICVTDDSNINCDNVIHSYDIDKIISIMNM